MTRFRRLPATGAFAAIVAVAATHAAWGQGAGSALKGHDTDAPVDVSADRIEVQDRANRAMFTGNVDVRQGNLQLNSARITVVYASNSGGGTAIERIEASGGVTMRSPTETARSQFAIYDIDRRLVTMIGAVRLDQGANRIQGGRLVFDLASGRAVMDGGTGGAPGASGTGRVTGRFTVPRRTGS